MRKKKTNTHYIEKETASLISRILVPSDINKLSELTNESEYAVSMIVKGKKTGSEKTIGIIMDKVRAKAGLMVEMLNA